MKKKSEWEPNIEGAIKRLNEARAFAQRMSENPYVPKHCKEMFATIALGLEQALRKCLTKPDEDDTFTYEFVKPEGGRR